MFLYWGHGISTLERAIMDDNEIGNKIDFVEPKPPLKIKNTHVKIYEDKNVTGAWSDASELTDIEIKTDD